MKKIAIAFSALVVVAAPVESYGGDDVVRRKPKKQIVDSVPVFPKGWISMYPFAAVGSSLMWGYQHRFSSSFGLHAALAVGVNENSNYYEVQEMTNFYLEAQGRYYAFNYSEKNGFFTGLYAAPFLRVKRMAFEYTAFEVNRFSTRRGAAFAVGGGTLVGAQLGWKALVCDVYLGVGVQNVANDYRFIANVEIDKYRRGVFFHPGVSIGVKIY
ncbi:MAG: hypothetical protein RMM53_07720 [Bacteroidia bacterium]|nr:hypothetical protein [Bacteroidia bacterium]